MELGRPIPISQMGTLRPSEAPNKAEAGPDLEPGTLSAALLPHHHLTSSVLYFLLFPPLIPFVYTLLPHLHSPSSTLMPFSSSIHPTIH